MTRVKLQTLLDRSNKNMASGTHAVVRETALEVIKRAYKEGINVQISEGHRSYARQNDLYAQGRTKPGNIVTNARGGQSWHNFGIAVDYFLTTSDGSKAVWTVNNNWRRVAQIAKNLGFEWGGDWTSFKDYPHLQMTGGYTLAQLRNGAKPKLTSKVNNPTPAPSQPSKPASTTKWTEKSGNWTGGVLKQGDKGKQVTQLQQLLANNHYYPKKGAKNNGVDGYFGADTKNAVERYQTMHGLEMDGIAGKDTYTQLKGKKASVPSSSKTNKNFDLPNATYWVKSPQFQGSGIKTVQQALASIYYYPDKNAKNNGVDSYYGPKTASAVKRFQSMYGLNQDGSYGPATRQKLDQLVN